MIFDMGTATTLSVVDARAIIPAE
ncbi:MAG: hypothetical protein ACLSB9_03550 [Hydrogeniiclostridium mannosilyticum]